MKAAILCAAALLMPGLMPAQQSNSPERFVQQAAQVNMTQANLGQMAQQQAASQDVKDFGRKLNQDCTQAYQRLSAIASQNGWTMPRAIDSQHQQEIQNLANLSGQDFDRQFAQQEQQYQQQTLQLYRNETQQGQNQALKQYAADMEPMLQQHIQTAQNLGRQGANQPMANATMPPSGSQPEPAQTRQNNESNANEQSNANRHMTPPGNNGQTTTKYGTVTRYEKGKTLEVKMRDRVGRHVYDLSSVNATVPENLSAGSQVVVTESVDPNGRRSIQVDLDTGASRSAQPGQQQR